MVDVEKAAFSFESFKVPMFSYNESNHSRTELKLGFLPTGKYNTKNGEFELKLQFITHEADNVDRVIFELTAVAIFKFSKPIPFEDIPSFFYRNAIAIMFPYLRAFISTLTLQANTKLLNLGLMNLSDLEQPLKNSTISIFE